MTELSPTARRDHTALLQLLLNPEVAAIQQDPGCVQASLARWQGQGQIWAKPLAATGGGGARPRTMDYNPTRWP